MVACWLFGLNLDVCPEMRRLVMWIFESEGGALALILFSLIFLARTRRPLCFPERRNQENVDFQLHASGKPFTSEHIYSSKSM
jgi:hypothetical protein